MNKLRKVGLTALAGSLVAVSANAVDLSISGTSKLTYTTTGGTSTNQTTGNPWGSANAVAMTGSGDVGWATVTIKRTIGDGFFDDTAAADASSAWQKMNLGDMGEIAFDSNGGGLVGLGAYDDLLPSAYEEMWNGLGTGGAGTGSVGSNNVWSYKNTFMDMVTIGVAHTKGGNGGTGDNSSSGAGATGTTTDLVAQIKPIDGLTVSGGTSKSDRKDGTTQPDDESASVNIVYATGPATLGYRVGTKRVGTTDASAAGTDLSIEAWAVSFNVNDELSVSYGEQDITHHKTTGTADVEENATSFNISYTMGAMTIAAQMGDSSNSSGTANLDDENTIIAMTLAF